MKKKFTFLMTAMALILAIMGPREAWGQAKESYTATITSKIWSNNGTQTLNNVNWTLTNDGNYYGYDATKGQQVGSGNKPAKSMTLATTDISGTISKIIINTSGASSVSANISVSVNGTSWGDAKAITSTASNYTFTGTGSGEIVFTWTQTSSKALYFKSITVEYEAIPAQTLESIAVQTPPTKTTYNAGETFDPTGLVITATYDTGDPEDIAYAGNEDKFTFEPSTSTALTTANTNVIITYGGKSCNQDITVNLIKLATPANLQATNVTSTSATLTWDEVANASSYEVKLNGVAKTATTNSLLVEDLTASTAYIWTVKAIGDGTTYENSEESTANNFTTLAPPSIPYTVTFNAGTNGTCSTTELTETSPGAGVTLPEVTPNTGYQFVGWATTNTATEADAGEAGETYYPTENITLYAVYNEVYTINYMVNGVNTGVQENVVQGTALVFPEVSAPDADHVFCGWVTTAIEGTQPTAPEYVNTEGLTATQNITYYAVFAEQGGSAPAEEKTQTLQYDTWTYSGPTTDKSSYRLFGNGSYIESAAFDLSKLSKVIVYGGTFGGAQYNSLTIGDGTNTWKSVTVSGSSQTGTNTYTSENATALSGTNELYITSKSGDGSNNGIRISKVEIFTMEGGYTYSNYCTTIVTKVLTSISLSGEYPTVFWKGEAFSHEGMTVTAHYNDESTKDVTSSATFTGYDMAATGEQTVTVTYDTQSTTYGITVKTIANTQATAYTVAEAKAIIDANPAELATTEVYVQGIICQIDSYNSQYNSITYWISTDGTQDNMFEVYSGKNLNNTNFTSISDIVLQADVIVYGKIKKFNSTYEFDKNNYLVSYTAPQSYSITLNQPTGGIISADKETAAAGETVTITIEPASGYTLATLTGATFNETVDPELLTYTFTMPAEEVTISATFNAVPTYTISFTTNGVAETATIVINQGAEIGSTLPEPTATNVPNGYTFRGWSAGDVALTDVEPTYITAETVPTGDMTLKAVFAMGETSGENALVKMVAGNTLNNGDKIVIVAHETTVALYQETVSSSYVNIYTFENNFATIMGNDKNWLTVSTAEGGFTLGDATNGYLYSSGNNLYIGGTAQTWTLSDLADGTFKIQSDGRNLSYRHDLTNQYWRMGGASYGTSGQTVLGIYKISISSTTYSNFCTTVNPISGNLADATTVANTAYYISAAATVEGKVTINGVLGNADASLLIINDGGQLIVNNKGVKATAKKNITGTEWYTISSPLANSVEFAEVENLIPSSGVTGTDYDLYRLNEAEGIWENSRIEDQTQNKFTTIDKGRGYLYARKDKAQLAFAGEINVADVECTLTIGAANGFNLIGNPFMQNIKLTDVKSDGTAVLADGFYVLTNQNTWDAKSETGIAPLQGFLVQAKTAGNVTISKPTAAPSKGERSEQNTNIEMIVSNSTYRDNAFAMFGEGIGLNKVNHRNAEAPMLYVPQDGEKFAIAFMDENTTVFPLNFKAMTTGKYSISLKATDNINTLVLVDNMTGVETNMLLESSYSFNGSPADSDGRFTVKLSISHNNGQSDNEHFVYQNGSELVVNGEGTLQIFDVLGRVVISEEVHGQTVYVGNLSEGAYIVRMTGNEIKTQKIIIR